MSTFDDFDDSFDSELANIDLTPSDPKNIKIVEDVSNTPVVSSSGAIKKVHKKNCVLVSNKQRGNPLLKSIGEVPYEFDDIVPDYQVGETTCVLYLSLKYHNLNPDYIHGRLKKLGHMFELRILLVEVDIPVSLFKQSSNKFLINFLLFLIQEPYAALKHLTRVCLLADLTLMVAWSSEEAGEIIETYKLYENSPPDMIMERPDQDTHQVVSFLVILFI